MYIVKINSCTAPIKLYLVCNECEKIKIVLNLLFSVMGAGHQNLKPSQISAFRDQMLIFLHSSLHSTERF